MNIHIEYCIKWNYGPEFDRVSKIIKKINTKYNISGNKGSPRSGAFEIELNGKNIFSKLNNGRFPKELELKEIL